MAEDSIFREELHQGSSHQLPRMKSNVAEKQLDESKSDFQKQQRPKNTGRLWNKSFYFMWVKTHYFYKCDFK